MLRALLARQLGDDPPELEDVLRHRWNSINVDPSRELATSFADSLCSIDISTPDGALLLCAGVSTDIDAASRSGVAAVFALSAQRQAPSNKPLALTTTVEPAYKPITCAKWMPGDAALFVSADTSGCVSVWDTSRFAVALKTELGANEKINALDMSGVPGARSELVAVARSNCYDVTLFDLGTGACTHRLEGHGNDVNDVVWSPTNPFMLASCAKDGAMRLFDVRRSGRSACLAECLEYQSRHVPVGIYEREATDFSFHEGETKTAPPTKRRKESSTKRLASGGDSTTSQQNNLITMRTSPLLGLGCIWELGSMSQLRRRKRRFHPNGVYSVPQLKHCLRVRFTPDGLMVVCGNVGPSFKYWDVPTGRLIGRRLYSGKQVVGNYPIFEIARDGIHMFSDDMGYLRAYSLEDGTAFWRRAGHLQPMSDMAVHPVLEEVYTYSEDHILCWSPADASTTHEAKS